MTELHKAALQQLLDKEAQGELSAGERQMLDSWYEHFDVSHADLKIFRDAAHEEQVKERLLRSIVGESDPAQQPSYKIIRFKKLYQWSSVAAVFLILIGYGVFRLAGHKPETELTSNNKPASRGQVKTALSRIVLSDGSIVVLNKGSHLNYPEKFFGSRREVYLSGEGYFDIQHDAKKPFLVHTGKITTRVLGTAFNIKTGTKGNTVEVTVIRGKVAVSDQEKTLAVLLPDQKISYNTSSHTALKESANAKIATLWKEEDLVLNDIPLEQAVGILQERYGVPISLATDKIRDCRFTAFFLNTTSLSQVMSVISRLNNLSYTNTKNGAYILSGEGCELSTLKP